MTKQDQKKIEAMRAGGRILAAVRNGVVDAVEIGITFAELEALAQKLIAKHGAKPSFSTVAGYDWATCIMKNDEMCHGIPTKEKIVEEGDIITVDVGVLYEGYHTDTTMTIPVGAVPAETRRFLKIGEDAMYAAIKQAVVGKSVWHVSYAMQRMVESAGYGMVYQLTGHGVGKELHMEPSIPCVADPMDKRVLFKSGQTVAIEVMHTMGKPTLVMDDDGWTFRTQDGSLAGMFEHTVLITDGEPEILTK